MAETEPLSDVADDALKGIGKTKALNGHSNFSEEKKAEEESSKTKEKIENGEREWSPQVNGDISDKSALDNCELMETDDNISSHADKESSEVIKDTPEKEANKSVASSGSGDCNDSGRHSEEKGATSGDSDNKSVNLSDNSDVVSKDSAQSTSSDSDNVTPATDGVDIGKDKSSEDKDEQSEEKSKENENEMSVDLTVEEESKKDDNKDSKENETVEDSSTSEEQTDGKESKETEKEDGKETEKEDEKDKEKEDEKDKEKEVEKDKEKEDGKDTETEKKDQKDGEKPPATPSKSKKKDKDQPKPEFVKRVTRSASGIVKPVRYIDSDPKLLSEDEDDEIRITKEVKKDPESDIEMIEESDPLAISDADVRKAKEASKAAQPQERFRATKRDPKGKDSNVIIIDTNTLLKGQQGNQASAATAHSSRGSISVASVSASAQTTASNSAAANIQTAIQAITGGNPAIQGLQSAYLNAIQQVLVAQGGSQVSNPHYIATLQQYYNTLGALQDDAYVIEAPSFIVPYVMEGKPTESIKDYLTRINKEAEEKVKKEEEEKKKIEEEERKKKEEEEQEKKKKEEEEQEKKKEEEGDKSEEAKEDKEITEDDKDKAIKDDKKTDEKDEEKKTDDEEMKTEDEAKKTDDKKTEEKEKDDEKMEVDEESKKEEEKEEKMETDETSEVKAKDKDEEKDKNKEKDEEKQKDDESEKTKTKEEGKGSGDENKENKKAKKDDEDVIDLDNEPDKPAEDDLSHLGRWEGYYKSALGKFFLDLGLNQAQEFIQSDLLRMQKRRLDKMKTNPSKQDVMSVKTLEKQLNFSKKKNAHLHVPLKTCKFCSFKSESSLVMQRHLESPHMVNYTYKCNFCEFETRGPQVILFHTEAEHNVRGRLERAPAFFQCPLCPFEDNNKSKMTRHSFSCTKKFKADKNCDLHDWEPPAKIPKIHRGRPNSFGKTLDALKMPNILPKNLGGLSLNLQNAISSGLLGNAAGLNSLAGRGRGRPIGSYKNLPQPMTSRAGALMYQNRVSNILQPMGGAASAQQLSIANQVLQSVSQGAANRSSRMHTSSATAGTLIPGLAASSSITIQSVQNKTGNSKSPQQPSISITPLPRSGTQSPGGKSAPASGNSNNSQRPAFVICEICDGYIKDLEQLRNHMNLIHKVKIHPKMIYNRPPLNCQKCQHRFFTDQGLERHLLGTHGLVTSSMQEAANKGKDAGRCPICGKVFQWKLLNHVSRDHKMTLKPAHLSYKCTVCTATFNMYRLFENHVYSAHSVVNKNKGSSEGSSSNSAAAPASKKQTTNTTAEAPLKINDEITIIPQPTFKSPKTDSKTSTPKKSDSPTMSKEITITKVGSRTSRRSGGGGVEVISLDDSPQKKQTDEPSKKRPRETSTSKRARTSS